MSETKQQDKFLSIWWFAFGYFACYAPYSALTKYLSKYKGLSGNELLPLTAFASLLGMFAFISAMRWWKHAHHKKVLGFDLPVPGPWTLLSGLCTAAVIPTTTLAYTFGGVSIVFMMLLMRGGVLIIAPVVDVLSGRKPKWYSVGALLLSIGSLLAAVFIGKEVKYDVTVPALINLAIYLAAYFVRLRFMSRLAKSDDENARTRYFVEEQMVATPALMLALGFFALFGEQIGIGQMGREIAHGFANPVNGVGAWTLGIVAVAVIIGVLSQGTGIFGGLILLDKRENTFCVPVNRVSSLLAGVVASYGLWLFLDAKRPGDNELVGVGLLGLAIALLSIGPMLDKRMAARAAVAAPVPLPVAAPAAEAPAPQEKHG